MHITETTTDESNINIVCLQTACYDNLHERKRKAVASPWVINTKKFVSYKSLWVRVSRYSAMI